MSESEHKVKKYKCWIDGSFCYAGSMSISLEHCKLCQKVKVNRYAIRHEQPPTME
jgi:hypothetical protein